MKWRKVKKQFNKDKGRYIGHHIQAKDKSGNILLAVISNVKIRPAGGKRVNYEVEAKISDWKPVEETIDRYEKAYQEANKGWSASFDMKIENPTNEIKNLLK